MILSVLQRVESKAPIEDTEFAAPFHSLGGIQSCHSQHIFSAKHYDFSKSTRAANLTQACTQHKQKRHVSSSR